MEYMTLKEAAEKWGVTPRRVNYYCARSEEHTSELQSLAIIAYSPSMPHPFLHRSLACRSQRLDRRQGSLPQPAASTFTLPPEPVHPTNCPNEVETYPRTG